MQRLNRCRICGEVYFGLHPSHCPYCGAHGRYIIPIEEWFDENEGVDPNESEIKDLEKTRQLEYDNTRFYRAAAKSTKIPEIKGYFKYLAKIENEHYDVVCKILKYQVDPEIFKPSEELGSDLKNLERSKENEEHASKLYAEFVPKTKNHRIKEIFMALSEVESDHIDLDVKEIVRLTDKEI